jgi:predicted amidophosphoribosyltransferase
MLKVPYSDLPSRYWAILAELPIVRGDPYTERKPNQSRLKELLVLQSGTCALCKSSKPIGGKHDCFYMDHCHKTLHVRGMMCSTCNLKLGRFEREWQTWEEDVADMRAASGYYVVKDPQLAKWLVSAIRYVERFEFNRLK